MKLLFITDNYPPEVNAPATRTYEHCRRWVEQGVQVTVVTCAPNFPAGKVYPGYKNKLYQKEYVDGIEVIRVWSYITANKGFAKRVLDYLSFALMAFVVGLFRKFDLIVATSPQFFTTWAAWALSIIKRRPWIFELRDLWPESIKTVGAMRQGRLIDFLEKIELGLYRHASLVIPVTDAFKKNLVNRGMNEEKLKVVTNGANLELYAGREQDNALRRELGLDGKFVVAYIGTHGMAHSLDFIVESLAKLDDKEIHFLFIGDGAMKSAVVERASQLELTNVTFLNPIPKEEVPRYLSICDASLAPLKKSDTFKTVIPSKIFEASAMEKPTLLGVEGQAQEIIETYSAGLCFEPENSSDFLDKTVRLKTDRQLYLRLQQGCRSLAADFDRRVLADRMLEIMRGLVGQLL